MRRERSRARRVAPIAAAAALAFAGGAVVGAGHVSEGQRVAQRYAAAWAAGDLARMYALTDARDHGTTLKQFAAAYRDAEATATATGVRFGPPHSAGDGRERLEATIATRAFGIVHQPLVLPIDDSGDEPVVAWAPNLAFPGLRPGEQLGRQTTMPPRAALLARDGTPLAKGEHRTSPLDDAASIAGSLGPIPADRAQQLRAQGVPGDAQVGVDGLERIFDDELRGTPGGTLLAGARVLARRAPRPGTAVRTTISPRVQEAAVTALAGRLGGVVALKPRSGEVLAAAGIPLSGLQPPGSTFKIITVTAGLDAGVTEPSKTYPVQTAATLSGVQLENADGEYCGGDLVEAFAQSCNSVFAPMGVAVGDQRLVATAERFGFNHDIGIPGAATPTIPQAGDIGDDLALGATSIGQGRVQASALEMALVAATIADHGRRPRPTFRLGERRGSVRVTSRGTARTVERLMQAVVTSGTGTAAAIPGVTVAGKTGTAELMDSRPQPGDTPPPEDADAPPDTDAWFVAFAPAGKGHRPRVAVGVMLVRAGAGGDAAAPAARTVLAAALQHP